jgi:thioredoxin-related protein
MNAVHKLETTAQCSGSESLCEEAVTMKAKIEVVANLTVVLLAIVIGSIFVKDRFFSPGPQVNEVKVGDRLTQLDGWDWRAHDRTLMLVLRKGCHFCEDSAPFYQRLVATQHQGGSTTALIAVFPDKEDAVKEVMKSEGLEVKGLAGVPLEGLKVSGTPTVLLVDKSGTVLNAWIGVLSPRQELEVMKAVACRSGGCGGPA